LVISAKVAVAPDYHWETVAPKIRAALLDAFGFDHRELGQHVFKSRVIAAIQRVAGVVYSNVQVSALEEASIIKGLAPRDAIPAEGAGVVVDALTHLSQALKTAGPQSRARCCLLKSPTCCPRSPTRCCWSCNHEPRARSSL
jgi:hypothetical protein